MTELRTKYNRFDHEIYWVVDSMYSDALDDIYRAWEKSDPRPTVAEVQQMLAAHDSGLGDAWIEYMEDWEDEDAVVDPEDSPSFVAAVDSLVRSYQPYDASLFEDIEREARRHKNVDTSDAMVEAILFRHSREWAEAWVQWKKDYR